MGLAHPLIIEWERSFLLETTLWRIEKARFGELFLCGINRLCLTVLSVLKLGNLSESELIKSVTEDRVLLRHRQCCLRCGVEVVIQRPAKPPGRVRLASLPPDFLPLK